MKAQKIPETDSIEELAEFWDTHDLTDFEDQLEEVREPVFQRRPDTVIPVRLRRQEVEALKRSAKAQKRAMRLLSKGVTPERFYRGSSSGPAWIPDRDIRE